MKPRIVTAHVESLHAAEGAEPDNGVYLVAHTFAGGRVLGIDAHFDRLTRSAQALGVAIEPPRDELRARVAAERRRLGAAEVRFRITAVLEGSPWYRVLVERYAGFDPELRRMGIQCATVLNGARVDPVVKSTRWLRERASLVARDAGAATNPPHEYLLLDAQERAVEGASSNFFAVVPRDEGEALELWTPLAGVLPGITRAGVLSVSHLPHRDEAVHTSQLGAVRECFISSSTRGVVPIRGIDSHRYPAPGEHTERIMAAFDVWAYTHSEPLVG